MLKQLKNNLTNIYIYIYIHIFNQGRRGWFTKINCSKKIGGDWYLVSATGGAVL